MPNGQIGQDKKNPFQKETEIPGQGESVFEKETEVLASQVEGLPEIPFPEELRETLDPELLRAVSQAIGTFAPDVTSVIPEAFKITRPRGIFEKPGIITLDDVFSGEVESLMPAASMAVRDRATGFESFEVVRIGPLRGPIGRGVIGGTVRMAMNMGEALIKKPAETIIGFITAIPLLTFKGLQGFIEDTPLPDITIAGNEDALELVREKFADIIGATPVIGGGRMSQEQMDEAHRGFKAILAAAATGRILFVGAGVPSLMLFSRIGVPAAEAVKKSKLLALQVSAVGALGTFGAVGGDPEEMEKNFVAFAIAAIPLGLMFHAFGAIGRVVPKVNNGPSRAMVYQQERAARPFNQETTVVPEVRVDPITDPARLLGRPKEVRAEVVKPEAIERPELVREVDPGTRETEAIKLEEPVAELGLKEPEPLNPDVLAVRLDNYVQNNGDVTKIIIQNLDTEPSGMVVVPGTETPSRALTLAREIAGKDAIVAVHQRPDGRFDIAVGRKGSPLDNPNNFKQFTEEGYFAGQKISVNGEDLIYIGKTGEQAFVRVPGDPRLVKINLSDIRRPKDVSVGDPFESIAIAQRGEPERAMLRVQHSQISQLYGWTAEHVGDLTHRMSDSIRRLRGNFLDVEAKVKKTLRVLTEGFGYEREVLEQIVDNTAIESGLEGKELNAFIRERRGDQEIRLESQLTETERVALNKLKELGQRYADAHRQIPVFNDVQIIARDAAIALGEFRFQDAVVELRKLKAILDQGQAAWESRATKPPLTPEKQLEGVITPEEIEVFKALKEEIHPLEPSTEAKTFDQIRQEASTNGLELTRTASNTFIVRDRATGQELFKGATKEDAEAFINDIGQEGTVVFDGDIPIDTDIPGSVTPPPSPGLRVNEPMDFPPNTKVGTIIDLFQSLTPFITPFKDWAAATDNILGTRIFSEVYIPTQETQGRSLSRAMPWLKELQKIEKIAVDAGLSPQQMEMAFDYIETRSISDLLGSHLKGLGPLKNRSVTEMEVSSYELLKELDVDTFRLYEYIRLRNQLFYAEAQSLKTNIENLDPVIKKAIEDEIIGSKDMTPNEMAGVQIFDHIRAQDLNDISLYVVSRLVEADRGGALSQADFAAKNNMSAAQIRVANEIVRLQDEVAAIPDIPIEDAQLIRGYMAHYAQHQTASPEGSVLNQGGVSRDMSFVNSMIRSGETNVYDRNPIAVTARYIKNAFDAIEFNDAWNNAKRYVDKELGGQFGREGSVASWVARSYLSDIRGIPGAATKFTQQAVDAFFKKMGWKMELNIRRDLVNTYLAMTNAAFMGARPGLAVRDLMQFTVFHYARFGGVGGKRTMRALELATKLGSEGTKQLRDAGELPTIGIIEFETAAQMEASAIGKTMKGLPAMTRKIAEAGLIMSGQRNAYEFGYKGTYLEARETALREITNFVDGKITKEEAYKRIGLDTYNLQTKKAFDTFVTSGEYERAANFLGQQTAREIMGVYGRANHPWGWGTNLGRLMSHYGTWSSNALAFILGGISRGSKKQRLAFAARLGMTQAAAKVAGDAVGLNMHSWLVLPGLFFTGGPAVQTADLIITALTGYGRDKDAAKKRLMQLFPASNDPRSMFIPGSYVVGDWLQAIKNADNPIEFFGRGFSIPLKKGRSWLDDF